MCFCQCFYSSIWVWRGWDAYRNSTLLVFEVSLLHTFYERLLSTIVWYLIMKGIIYLLRLFICFGLKFTILPLKSVVYNASFYLFDFLTSKDFYGFYYYLKAFIASYSFIFLFLRLFILSYTPESNISSLHLFNGISL